MSDPNSGFCSTKKCFKCGEVKPTSSYYAHPQMKDGFLGKCKECAKSDVRAARSDATRAYDRNRYTERSREHKARQMVQWAIESGTMHRPDACWACGGGGEIEGHHADYSNPLGVIFLCKECHAHCHKATTAIKGKNKYARRQAAALGIVPPLER